MSTPWTHRTMIVTAANQVMAQTIAATLAPGGSGSGMWTTSLSATGNLPATHYVSAGLIQQEFADLMDDANALFAACQAAGLPYTLLQIQGLLSTSTVKKSAGTPDPLADLASLGLKIINPAVA